ncbi:type II toxin-antitoxin system Phd/YefM family antitoxin [Longimicrobium sp.]|uniref:type II toxin-antitoxin system Phd/YefM family antitoxin n=1 Tax=Longimicrobium sp. TaxID=2029185 RepID=UPI002B825C3C|nr:type II toxin-antitoxin system Phd/YefM family antitoxin [Longimicrobium sp.]HSU18073.1 type II toxin-antitoxin system Phd/YefM family antitoxin [Longimicrobium sp.]
MTIAMSVAEAKATLSERIRDVEKGEQIVITRHGKSVAALVSPEDLEHLKRLRAAGPQGGLASLAGGWEGSDELVGAIEASPRGGRRATPNLD